jgi:hypothetical protein
LPDFGMFTPVKETGNLQPFQETPGGKFQHMVADGAAIGDSLSPYSGGTLGGVIRRFL